MERVSITLRVRDRWLVLEISDAGLGFDARSGEGLRATGAGLRGMRERASLIGANFTVDSAVGGGTRIQLSVPVRTAVKTDLEVHDGLG